MASSLIAPVTGNVEFIDGLEIAKPLAKKLHGLIQAFLIFRLMTVLSEAFQIIPELNVLCGQDRLVPDVTVARADANYDDGDLRDSAALAVEILSPGQTFANLIDKAARLVAAGTPCCWVIWPERRRAWMYTANDFEEAREHLIAKLSDDESVRIPLSELWSSLERRAPSKA